MNKTPPGPDGRTPAERLGAVLVRHRTARGWNQRQFAEALDRKSGVVSAWEHGHSFPDGLSLVGIVKVLGGTVTDLLREAAVEPGTPAVPPPTDAERARLAERLRVLAAMASRLQEFFAEEITAANRELAALSERSAAGGGPARRRSHRA